MKPWSDPISKYIYMYFYIHTFAYMYKLNAWTDCVYAHPRMTWSNQTTHARSSFPSTRSMEHPENLKVGKCQMDHQE